MTEQWIRREPTRNERLTTALAAATVGAVAGALAWYLGRIAVAREPLDLRPPPVPEGKPILPPGRETP